MTWITHRDFDTLRESLLWAHGLSDGERQTLRVILERYERLQDKADAQERELGQLRRQARQRESQGG